MPVGQVSAYDLTVGVKVNMDEAIYMLSPQDTPLLTGVGADGIPVLGSQPVDEIVFSWMDDTILVPRSVSQGTSTTGDTFITLASDGERLRFSTGDIVAIQRTGATVETVRVTGYATTAATLDVTRAWSGSAATISSGSILVGLGTALAEGTDPENARSVDRVESSNVTQIFGPTKIDLTRTEQQVSKYGITSEWSHQLMGRVKENAIAREQAFLYGPKVNSTSGKIRTTGGLRHFVTTNVSTATTLDLTALTAVQQTGYNAGGFSDVLMSNPVAFSTLNATADTSIVRTDINTSKRGRTRVEFVETEFGSVLIARNRWCFPHDAFGFNREQVVRRVLQSLIVERLAKTGDSDQAQLVCEEGLEVKGEEHMYRFHSLNYTGSV